MRTRAGGGLLFAALLSVGCAATNPSAPPPLRPIGATSETPGGAADCPPTDPDAQAAPLRYGDRAMAEAAKLTELAQAQYAATLEAATPPSERASALAAAVDTLHTALAADPYQIDATYLLASAYARASRKQCALNLLERLVEMKHHPSRSVQVERKLDMLLGQRGTTADPSFDGLRRDPTFRELIAEMCRDENDAACVDGTR